MSTPPSWIHAGVLYSSDNDALSTSGAVLQVLLTAAYMNDVVKEHYQNGWTINNANLDSQVSLSTYTMNVDTVHVPQWGRMRLYPTLDPRQYPLDTIQSAAWYTGEEFGDDIVDVASNKTKKDVYEGLFTSWNEWKTTGTTKAMSAAADGTRIKINSIAINGEGTADYTTEIEKRTMGPSRISSMLPTMRS